MSKHLLRAVMVFSIAAVALAFTAPVHGEDAEKAEKKKSNKRWDGVTIEAIDAAGGTITAKKKVKSETFKIGEDCKFATAENKDAKLSDLKVGDYVNITFTEDNGTKVAHRVSHKAKKDKDDDEKK